MFTVLLILLAAVDVTCSLECIAYCSLTRIPFGDDLRIRAGEYQRRVTAPTCTVDITLNFHKMQYSATFGDIASNYERISISSGEPLEYRFSRQCSFDIDCVLRDAQKRIDELTGRPYNAVAIYEEIAPLITSQLAGDQIDCFGANSSTVTCRSGEICRIIYDPRARRVTSRGCVSSILQVYFYDSPTYASSEIKCNSGLCNIMEVYEKVKSILNKNNLVDANGRINATAAPEDG